MIFLTKLMDDMQCPDDGISKVIDRAKNAVADTFDFIPSNKSREKAIEFCYLALYNNLVTDLNNQFMSALICYIDKAHVIDDKHVLESLTFTLAVFKEKARWYAVEFWRPLGCVS
jgi:hypothetical protein